MDDRLLPSVVTLLVQDNTLETTRVAQMIDNEADFGNILDGPEEAQPAAKLNLKPRAKLRKTTLRSKASAPKPAAEIKDGKAGAVTQGNSSEGRINSQERASLTCPSSETVHDKACSQGVVDTPSEDVLTVPLRPLNNCDEVSDSAAGGASALGSVSQDDEHVDGSSKLGAQHESLAVSDSAAGGASALGSVSQDDEHVDASSKLGAQHESLAVSDSAAGGASALGSVSQDDEHVDGSSKLGTQHESLAVSDSHPLPATSCGNTIDDVVDFGETFDAHAKEETVLKLQPKLQEKHPRLAAKSRKTNQKVPAPSIGAVIQNERSDTGGQIGLNNNNVQAPTCHENDGHTSDSEALIAGEPKGKGKSVSFNLPDASEEVAPRGTSSVIPDFRSFLDDLYDMPQKTLEKECTDKVCQYPEGEPPDHSVEQLKSNVGEIGSSMKLRSRKNLQKVGVCQQSTEDVFDEESIEPSTSEQDNDSTVNYTAGSKRKNKRKSKDSVEEPQQGGQTDKSQVSSRRKKISKDAPTEKTEKKLTHRIRQKRMKEVKTLLETPYEEIDHRKLSAAHLRLLQEARERIGKETQPGPSSNASSSQHGNLDDFDCDRYDDAENFGEDRTETAEEKTKLNYHSYMNRQTRAKWSKSDTDLFYQGLRQFGSDFAMIQQLFPDKTRHHVRQKFKAEEKKNPMLIHDAIIHRSGDNLYFKKVIKQLNIEDVVPDISSMHKQDVASNQSGPATENTSDNFIDEEENSSNQLDKEQDMHMSDVQDVPGNSDGELGSIFDWY